MVLNRLDRERASLERSLESLRAAFGRAVVPLQLPIGEEKAFRGVVDLVAMKAWTFAADGSGKPSEAAIPAELEGPAQTAREALIEMVAEADDALMEKFFDAGTLTQEELLAGLKRGVAAGRVFPVLCRVGGGEHRHAAAARRPDLRTCRRRPSGRCRGSTPRAATTSRCRRPTTGPAAAFIWKTVADPFAGRITMFRVVSGSLKADSTVQNVTKDTPERLGHLVLLQGKTQAAVPEIKAGDIGAVAKLKESQTSDLIADKAVAFTLPAIKFPEPVISYAIEPKSRGDEEKISTALHRLQEEDPTINYTRDAQTKELLLAGQGQSHIEVTVAKLKRRFGVEVNLKLPRIPYRETITASTEAHGRHKKQTGGHGQFGDCKVKFEPLPRGTDFEFVNDIFGGSIPRQFVPAIEKGIQDARLRGFLAGYPMVDFRASVFDGSFHPVDSSEMSFKMAGIAGVQGRHVAGAPDAARADHGRRGLRAERLRRRPDGGPEQPARPDRRHGHARRVDRSSAPRCRCRRCSPTSSTSRRRPAAAGRITWSSRTTKRCRRTCTARSSRPRRPSAGTRRRRKSEEQFRCRQAQEPIRAGEPALVYGQLAAGADAS